MSRQVARMHHVYEMADAVLIWLGNADADSDAAMDLVSELQRLDILVFEREDKSEHGKPIATKELAQKWSALYKLLLRPYFRRLWIVQELTLASVPTAVCGDKYVSWHDVHQTGIVLQLHDSAIRRMCHAFDMPLADEMPPVREDHVGCPNCFQPRLPDSDFRLPHKLNWHREMRRRNQLPNFLYLCLLNRDAECGNPRDKIYALWNLAREVNDLGDFRPEYSLSVRDLSTPSSWLIHLVSGQPRIQRIRKPGEMR